MELLGQIIILLVFGFIGWRLLGGSKPPLAVTRADFGSGQPLFDDAPSTSAESLRGAEDLGEIHPLSATLKIKYVDGRGEATQRVVTVEEFSSDGGGYLFGYCHLRQSVRTFRIDRVQQAVDVDSGEIIGGLLPWLHDRYRHSPAAAWIALLSDHVHALRALVYLAKADGTFTTKERDILVEHCKALLSREDLTRPDMNKALRSLPPTSLTAFRQVVGKLTKQPTEYRLRILDTARRMVATQRTMADEEAAALAYLQSKLGG